MVWRKIQEVEGLADLVNPIDGAAEKLGANTTTLGAIINFDLNRFRFLLLLWRQAAPPALESIDDEITGFRGAAKA